MPTVVSAGDRETTSDTATGLLRLAINESPLASPCLFATQSTGRLNRDCCFIWCHLNKEWTTQLALEPNKAVPIWPMATKLDHFVQIVWEEDKSEAPMVYSL